MKRLPPFSFAIVVILLMQTGCSSSILPLRDHLDLHRGEFRQKLADKKELTAKFLRLTLCSCSPRRVKPPACIL